jgi:ech hydrogenase subunit D
MSDATRGTEIGVERLLGEVGRMRAEGCRLVQVCATTSGRDVVLDYSFDKGGEYLNFRLPVAAGATLPSITPIYWCAFVYENELHDLFGLKFAGLAVDFGGSFYKTAVKHPFAPGEGPGLASPGPVRVGAPGE